MLKKIKSLILICLITAMIFPFGGVGVRSASAEVLPPFTSIVIDDGNAGYTASGTWRVSTGVKGYNNSSTRYTDTVNDTITWNPRLEAGKARISFYKVNWPDKADTNVKIEIVHNGTTDIRFLNLNPSVGGTGWIDLGEYDFNGVDTEFVRLTRVQPTTGNILTRVDAVKFEGNIKQKEPPLPPLRSRTLPNLSYTEKGSIQNDNYKATFYEATWDGGKSIVRDLFYKDLNSGSWVSVNSVAERLEEQWVLFDGNAGQRTNYYDTMNKRWITFDGVTFPDGQTAVLTDSLHVSDYDFQVNWSMAEERPEVSYDFTPRKDGNYVIGYQSFTTESTSSVNEVLSGFRSHAKMIGTVESTGLWEMTAPMSLVEKNDSTGAAYSYGVFVPSKELPVEFEPAGGSANQRLGMSLVNNEGNVQPIIYAPQLGTYSTMTAGSTYRFHIGLIAQKSKVYDAYRDILRGDYSYSSYRENVGGQSLTDAMFNMIDLIKMDPQGDDSVNYVPSPSGWWSRAKGFMDIENEDVVRTTTNGVLLGAYYLTGDNQLYDTRALPSIQYGVSRNGVGWSPKQKPVYSAPSFWKMASLSFDVSTVAAAYQMTGGSTAGIYALGQEEYRFRNPDQNDRGPVIQPLMMYRMTGDAQYLQAAKAAADLYIAQKIDIPETVNVTQTEFVYNFGKLWMEILELYEETKETKYLNAAYKEAKRYATMFVARPVPEGTFTIPKPGAPFTESFHWPASAKYDYPRETLPEHVTGGQPADNWLVSPSGLTYEAGNTSAYYRMNAQEAPFMMRLSLYTGDKLLQDIAHNAVIGRYSSYPGYYYKGFTVSQLEEDYPLLGPSEATSIYYHHMPAQLGQTMDYLISEQVLKSNGQISFPSVFETDFLWFKYHLFGHKPGTFYGNSNVWLWMPKGIVKTNNPQLNWITAESGDKFYVGLSNESTDLQQTSIELNPQIIGFDPTRDYDVTIIRDNGTPEQAVMQNGNIDVTVTGKGMTAVIVEGLNIQVPLHKAKIAADTSDASYFFDTHSPIDAVKGMLMVKPDETSYDAYVQAKTTKDATIYYSLDGGNTYTSVPDTIYPMEWSIRVNDLSQTFTYYVESEGKKTRARTLYLPDRVASPPIQPDWQAGSSIVVDNTEAETDGVWIRDTSGNGYYYDNYVYSKPVTGTATSKIRWRPELTESVTHSVYYRVPQMSVSSENWSTNASFTVYYSGGSKTITVDEKTSDGTWVFLGAFPFVSGNSGYVELTNKANNSRVVADAVMWVSENAKPQWESATLKSDRSLLEMTQIAQLSVTGYLDNGLIGDLREANVQYSVDRSDLAEVDSNGVLKLNRLDGVTNQIVVQATVSVDGVTLETPPLTIPIKDLTVIVDSTNTSGLYIAEGSWSQSNLSGYKIGIKSRYTTVEGSSATWKAQFPEGKYAVSIYKIAHTSGQDPNVKVEVMHKSVSEVTYINQSSDPGWVDLGTFDFTGDGSEYVKLTRVTPTTLDPPTLPADMIYTRADAVRFERHSISPGLFLLEDTINNVVGQPIEITFADDTAWRSALRSLKVDGQTVSGAVYSLEAGKLTLSASLFPVAKNYSITVSADGYTDSVVTQAIGEAPPLIPPDLTADMSNNVVGQPIEVTFTDDTAWRSALRSVKVDGQTVSGAVYYSLDAGKLMLSASLFPTVKNYTIEVSADGYTDAVATQAIGVAPPQLLIPPLLNADNSNHVVGKSLKLTFADDAVWRSKLRHVKVDDQMASVNLYSMKKGKLTLSASLFPTAKNYSIILSADGYAYSTVIQTILPYSSKGDNKDDDTNNSSDFNNDDDE